MALTKSDLTAIDKKLEKRLRNIPDKKEVRKIVEGILEEKGVVTGNDLREILEVNNEVLKLELRKEFVTKEDIKHLPTKEDFYQMVDKIMKEIKAMREERAVLIHRISDHEDRIVRVEKKVGVVV
jgi:hypothetical protein